MGAMPENNNHKKRILVVDDEEGFGRMVKLNLEETHEYEVWAETKGSRGFLAAKEFKPDLIFLDVIMPDMGGEEVARQLMTDFSTKNIPVVFLTGMADGNELDTNDILLRKRPVLAKPATLDEIISCIERCL